jgi:ParB-like chromosome segregation protein Spo0J
VGDGIKQAIVKYVHGAENSLDAIEGIRKVLHELSPCPDMPVDFVQLVPIEKVEPNDYNPNAVARIEMGLLLKSIQHDGFTQPVVTIYDAERDRYVIVDGFHRYFIMLRNEGIRARYHGLLPVTVIDKPIADRMASTIRHNRARGKHSVNGMANMVYKMLDEGMDDSAICNELGMEAEELLRLKHITGFSKLFSDHKYRHAWESKNQITIRREWERKQAEKG